MDEDWRALLEEEAATQRACQPTYGMLRSAGPKTDSAMQLLRDIKQEQGMVAKSSSLQHGGRSYTLPTDGPSAAPPTNPFHRTGPGSNSHTSSAAVHISRGPSSVLGMVRSADRWQTSCLHASLTHASM